MFNDLPDSITVADLKQRLKLLPAGGARPTRKADIIAAIAGYLLSNGARELWQQLDSDEQSAVAETVHRWSGVFDADRFTAMYGAVPKALAPDAWDTAVNKPWAGSSGLSLFFYAQMIPAVLRAHLAEFVPLPATNTMRSIAEDQIPQSLPESDSDAIDEANDTRIRLLCTEAMARQDLAGLLRLVESGRLSVSDKTGMAGAAALRNIDGLLAGGDWYSAEEDQPLDKWQGSPLRPMRSFAWPLLLQTAGLARAAGKTLELTRKGKAALSAPFQRTIREIYRRWRDKGSWDEFRRIEQIKGQTRKGRPMAPVVPRRQAIEVTVAEMPLGEWVEFEEFYRYLIAQGNHFEVARDEWKLYLVDDNYGSMGFAADSILDSRYLMVYFMEYLATLGMLDIGYTHPLFGRDDYGGLWGVDELLYLSRYDGLLYLRLNPLGAYCLGLSDDYAPQVAEVVGLFDVDEELGIRLLRPAEAAQGIMLEQFAQALVDDGWRVTPESLMMALENGLEPEDFHQFLQQNAASDLPAEVARLFESIAARRSAVADAGSAQLLRCASTHLAKALAENPAVAAYCLHAGGRMLVVPDKSMKRFRQGLREIGYMVPFGVGR